MVNVGDLIIILRISKCLDGLTLINEDNLIGKVVKVRSIDKHRPDFVWFMLPEPLEFEYSISSSSSIQVALAWRLHRDDVEVIYKV